MALPKKETFYSQQETKGTVQRLSTITDKQRFIAGVNAEVENRLQVMTTGLTDYIENLMDARRWVTQSEKKDPPFEQINQVFTQLDANLSAAKTPTAEYSALLTRRDEARQLVEHFKFKHDLHEPPVVAESEVWHWATLLMLLFAETMINSFSFGAVSTMGLVGGFGQAFLFTIVNLMLATLAGIFFKFKNHYDSSFRVIGWVVLVVFLCLIFLYNCFVGHYREALGAPNFQVAIQNSGATFARNPIGISDGGALLLVALGFLIAILAFIKIYNFEDPYPGYASVGRRDQDARRDLLSEREGFRLPKVRGIYEEAINMLRELVLDYETHIRSFELALSSNKDISSQLQESTLGFRGILTEVLHDFKNQLQRVPHRHSEPDFNYDEICERLSPTNPISDIDFTSEEEALKEMKMKKIEFNSRIDEEVGNLNADMAKDFEELNSSWVTEDEGAVEAA